MTCSVDECDRPVYARLVCERHYEAARRARALDALPRRPQRFCEVDGCDDEHLAKGLCSRHYVRVRDHGRLDLPTLRERFWALVDKSGECWLWTQRPDPNGYGRISINGKGQYVHRVAWELTRGPIPAGLVIDHLRESGICTSKLCVRPDHLEVVTLSENTRRQLAARRKAAA